MDTKGRVLYYGLCVASFLLFVVWMPRYFLPSAITKDAVTLFDGWEFTLEANGPVDVLALSENSTQPSILYDEAGKEVLRTLPETIPGNFAVAGTLDAGKYTLKGESTSLRFSGDNFVSFDCPKLLRVNTQMGAFGWVLFVVIMGLAMRGWSRE